MARGRPRRWLLLGLAAVAATLMTVLVQQPAGSPPARGQQARQGGMEPLGKTIADTAATAIARHGDVQDVQVAVRNGVALISVQPRPGLSPEEHRLLEQRIARETVQETDGITEAFVTIDPAVFQRIAGLKASQEDVEKRAGPRMAEANIRWSEEFDDVLRHMRELPNHAEARKG